MTGLSLDDEFLREVGLGGLDSEVARAFLSHCYATLEFRVGMRLARDLSSGQLDEFEALMDADDTDGGLAWLNENVPDYADVVREEYSRLKEEVQSLAPTILRIG